MVYREVTRMAVSPPDVPRYISPLEQRVSYTLTVPPIGSVIPGLREFLILRWYAGFAPFDRGGIAYGVVLPFSGLESDRQFGFVSSSDYFNDTGLDVPHSYVANETGYAFTLMRLYGDLSTWATFEIEIAYDWAPGHVPAGVKAWIYTESYDVTLTLKATPDHGPAPLPAQFRATDWPLH